MSELTVQTVICVLNLMVAKEFQGMYYWQSYGDGGRIGIDPTSQEHGHNLIIDYYVSHEHGSLMVKVETLIIDPAEHPVSRSLKSAITAQFELDDPASISAITTHIHEIIAKYYAK